jgi:hypothetical protein
MIKRLVIFLIRCKLGLKKYERFRFNNQASKANCYYFTSDELIKIDVDNCKVRTSTCSLNWLLNDKCRITIIGFDD